MNMTPRKEWLSIFGKTDGAIQSQLESRVEQDIAAKVYRQGDVEYLSRVDRRVVEGALSVDDLKLEKLRRLCQLWDVDLKIGEISSHRPIVGPIIVAIKKLFLPVLKALFRDTLRQQRDFNGAVISLLADLSRTSHHRS